MVRIQLVGGGNVSLGPLKAVVRVLAGGENRYHYECRDCGKNLDADLDECPRCGGSVAAYEL